MASAASSNLEKEVRKNIDDFAAEMIKINWEQLLSCHIRNFPQIFHKITLVEIIFMVCMHVLPNARSIHDVLQEMKDGKVMEWPCYGDPRVVDDS